MKPRFEVIVEKFEKLNAMPEGLTAADHRALLEQLDFDGIGDLAEDELSTYAAMALQDLEPEEAAVVVLTHVLSDKMTAGQIRNLSEEMKDERQWEENADMRCHEPIFNAQVLLSEAFPKEYQTPDIIRMIVRLTSVSSEGKTLLRRPISEPLLVRILADGMSDNAILKRFFEDQLAKGPFPEASQILWQYATESGPGTDENVSCVVTLYSPRYWVGPLEDVDDFSSAAFPDAVDENPS